MAVDAIGQNELKSVVTLQILNSSGTLKTLYGAVRINITMRIYNGSQTSTLL